LSERVWKGKEPRGDPWEVKLKPGDEDGEATLRDIFTDEAADYDAYVAETPDWDGSLLEWIMDDWKGTLELVEVRLKSGFSSKL
jgi:hypothetical protein